ncbi:hypothetical protein C1701_02705 [Actinoalloteichus sp. AHMU CJ021]|uniref:hypothetical protein n=1 Tax=Actinoalloteichus sp. AHMU CJ021 TaxID=2072503 RepID=UPI000CA021C7|nr:hypothetical protein C1701_02705 [Actinoalloteichus sp. AHMU CJ021]
MPPRRRTPWSPRLLVINAVLNTVTALLFTVAVVLHHRENGEINGWFVATGSLFAVSAVAHWVRWNAAVRERRSSDRRPGDRARPGHRTGPDSPEDSPPGDVAAPAPSQPSHRRPPSDAPGTGGATGGVS